MSATIRDVAKRAGVGVGTVSRVLNNSPLVSAETRRRVMDVIAELHYTPSQAARSLSLGKTLSINTIAPFFTQPSVVQRLRGIEATLAGSGYSLVVFNVEDVARRDACLRDLPRRERSDGLIIMSLAPTEKEVATIRASEVPVILVDTYTPGLPSLLTDDVAGGYMATRHLIELGHRRIGYVSDLLKHPLSFNFTSSRDRLSGYRRALDEAGIPFRPEYHVSGLHGRYEAHRLTQQLLRLPEPPTAIFAASDTQAMGVLEAARDEGISIPAQLSVIGYDDIDIAEYLGLTTIHQPLYESGARGVELLLDLMAQDERPRTPICEYLPLSLIVRNTTATIP